jgi:cytochrome c
MRLPPAAGFWGLLAMALPAAAALIGHGGAVTGIAVTPDGTRLLSASFDNSLVLWDLASGSKLATLEGHAAAVTAVAMFPDGHHAVSASDDRTIGYWDLDRSRLVARWSGHDGKVAALAVAPDGALVASGGWDGELRLWDPERGDSRLLRHQETAINAVAIAPDGSMLASGDHDGRIALWSLSERRLLATIGGSGFAVNALRFMPDGRLIAASADMTVRLWDLAARRELRRYEGNDEPLTALALTSDGAIVAAGGARGTMMLWHVVDGSFVGARYAQRGPVFALAFTGDGQILLSGGLDGKIRVWRAPDWHEAGGEKPPLPAAAPDEPADRGAALFRKCSACHDLAQTASAKAGPTLLGVFGRRAGTVAGYTYSAALKESGLVWNETSVDRLFALGPEAVVPGSKMPLQRMPEAQDRAELIRFLQRATRPGNPP